MEEMEPPVFKTKSSPRVGQHGFPDEEEFEMIDSSFTNETIPKARNKLRTEISTHPSEEIAETTPVIENSSPVQKRGRGRPPKTISSEIVDGTEGSNGHNPSFVQRRSRRLSTYIDLAHDQCQHEENPKNADEVLSILNTSSLPNEAKTDKEQTRGRGRPPGSKNKKTKEKMDDSIPGPKRGRGRPPGSRNRNNVNGKTSDPKRTVKKIDNLECKVRKKYNNMKRINKSINKPRYIPKARLEESLAMLRDPDHPIWENNITSCNRAIHRYYEDTRRYFFEQTLKFKYARQCTLRRDWVNLSKVLCLASRESGANFQPLMVKYGAICLAHADKQHFNKFVNRLLNVEDGAIVLKQCTRLRVAHKGG